MAQELGSGLCEVSRTKDSGSCDSSRWRMRWVSEEGSALSWEAGAFLAQGDG